MHFAGEHVVADGVQFEPTPVAGRIPIWVAARKRFVLPRSGYVRFSPAREAVQRRSLGVLLLLGVVTIVSFLRSYVPPDRVRAALAGRGVVAGTVAYAAGHRRVGRGRKLWIALVALHGRRDSDNCGGRSDRSEK